MKYIYILKQFRVFEISLLVSGIYQEKWSLYFAVDSFVPSFKMR